MGKVVCMEQARAARMAPAGGVAIEGATQDGQVVLLVAGAPLAHWSPEVAEAVAVLLDSARVRPEHLPLWANILRQLASTARAQGAEE